MADIKDYLFKLNRRIKNLEMNLVKIKRKINFKPVGDTSEQVSKTKN